MRRRDERGVAVVEAAFVIPLIFLFALGLVDVGLWVFQTGQASSAARDGARVGILNFTGADSGGTNANKTKILDAVNSRLSGQSGVVVAIECTEQDNPSNVVTCPTSQSTTIPTTRIKVSVSWDRPALTPITGVLGPKQVTASASMVLVGLPAP